MFRAKFVLVGIGLALLLVTPVSAQAVQTLRIGQKPDLGSFVTDSQGRTQPATPVWNPSGYLNNAVDQVKIHVQT